VAHEFLVRYARPGNHSRRGTRARHGRHSDRKVDVPATLSVVSFDDSRDSRVAQLTSYNPGYAAVAAMAVNYVLSPRRKAERRWAHAPSGTLIVRSSSAPRPRHS
jgi:DNA-binding LacI/PurR family transcriptional regulator